MVTDERRAVAVKRPMPGRWKLPEPGVADGRQWILYLGYFRKDDTLMIFALNQVTGVAGPEE